MSSRGDDWLERFFDLHFGLRPVDATFVGIHTYDDRLPETSEQGADAARAETDALLRAAETEQPSAELHPVDRRLALGQLRIQRWELGSRHFRRDNPATLVGEAVFGVMSLFLRDVGSRAERLEHARARLAGVPRMLRQAQRSAVSVPRSWIERGLRECAAADAFFGVGIGRVDAALLDAAAPARRAVAEYASWLRGLEPAADDAAACGDEALSLLFREGHLVDEPPAELARRASERLDACGAELDALPPPEPDPPTTADPAAFDRRWEEAVATIRAQRLATWPDVPVRYQPLPDWAREAAPNLYFLPYRAPSAFDRTPSLTSWILGPANEATIVANHVVHHGSLGHHAQNCAAPGSASRIGRVAGVDGVSRIALFCAGTMTEGWACYAVDVMREVGFLSPAAVRAAVESQLRMAARALVDVGLHQGRLSFAEAVAVYREHARMRDAAARAEVVKNSLFPGTAAMYLLGWERIHALRRAARASDLGAFHDRLVAHGSIPTAMLGPSGLTGSGVGGGNP